MFLVNQVGIMESLKTNAYLPSVLLPFDVILNDKTHVIFIDTHLSSNYSFILLRVSVSQKHIQRPPPLTFTFENLVPSKDMQKRTRDIDIKSETDMDKYKNLVDIVRLHLLSFVVVFRYNDCLNSVCQRKKTVG